MSASGEPDRRASCRRRSAWAKRSRPGGRSTTRARGPTRPTRPTGMEHAGRGSVSEEARTPTTTRRRPSSGEFAVISSACGGRGLCPAAHRTLAIPALHARRLDGPRRARPGCRARARRGTVRAQPRLGLSPVLGHLARVGAVVRIASGRTRRKFALVPVVGRERVAAAAYDLDAGGLGGRARAEHHFFAASSRTRRPSLTTIAPLEWPSSSSRAPSTRTLAASRSRARFLAKPIAILDSALARFIGCASLE